MVDPLAEDPTPHKFPTLTGLKEARAGVENRHDRSLESLMASEDMPDVAVLCAELSGTGRRL